MKSTAPRILCLEIGQGTKGGRHIVKPGLM